MTVQLLVLYGQPDDPDSFETHYRDVHGPIVDQIPGLLRWETGRVSAAADGGEVIYFRSAALSFVDEAALEIALSSEHGAAAAADYEQIAPKGSRMFVINVTE